MTVIKHTDAKSQFLFKNSILTNSTPTSNLNFPAKNGMIEKLIFLNKKGDFAAVCKASASKRNDMHEAPNHFSRITIIMRAPP